MNLQEYQAKKLFSKYNLTIPRGVICSSVDEIPSALDQLGTGPWVAKCQISAGGRGKSGGVKIIKSKEEINSFCKNWLGNRLITAQTDQIGETVHTILIESSINVISELYFSMFIDRNNSCIVCLVSNSGGVDVEIINQNTPSCSFHKIFLNPLLGPQIYQGRRLGLYLGLNFNQIEQFIKIFMNVGNMLLAHDLVLIEINPLVIDENNCLMCLDAKIILDQNAFFRQKKILFENNLYLDSMSKNINYIPLLGNIGCIVNGAGLAMATMDLLMLHGGKAANFLDVGGDVTQESIKKSIKMIMFNNKIKAILINIFGGIVSCKLIAEGIVHALSYVNIKIPIIVRLEGNHAKLANKYLINNNHDKYNIIISHDLLDAIKKSIFYSKLNN